MKKTISFKDFCDEFKIMDRYNSFSYEGKKALFDYIEQLEQDTGEELELDIIAIDCDFTEYSDLEEIKADYPNIKSIEDLENNTQVIVFNSGIIIQNF